MKFIGRVKELALLEQEYERNSAFVVVHGMRGIGKTSLIKNFIKGKRCFYYLATKELHEQCYYRFQEIMSEFCGKTSHEHDNTSVNWEGAFKKFAEYEPNTKKILVIDGFKDIAQVNVNFIDIVRKAYNKYFKNNNIMLIICDSYSFVSQDEGKESPNHFPNLPETTCAIKVKAMRFSELATHFPDFTFRELTYRYLVAGGNPSYFDYFYNHEPLISNIERHVLDVGGHLYRLPEKVLESEVREPSMYFSIMKAIASGQRAMKQICKVLDKKGNALSPYLNSLIDYEFIVKLVPVTEADPEKSRRGHYFIRNGFFEFWFQFIYPYLHQLEIGNKEPALLNIGRNLLDSGLKWRLNYRICRDIFINLSLSKKLDFEFVKVGLARDSKKVIVPVLAIGKDNDRVFAGFCSYNDHDPVNAALLANLIKACDHVPEIQGKKIEYGLFSMTGFEDALITAAECMGNVALINEFDVVIAPTYDK